MWSEIIVLIMQKESSVARERLLKDSKCQMENICFKEVNEKSRLQTETPEESWNQNKKGKKRQKLRPNQDLLQWKSALKGVYERSRLQTVNSEVVELSSDCEGSDEDDYMQSTPELDVISSKALTDVERENCVNYAKGIERRKRKRKTVDEGQ